MEEPELKTIEWSAPEYSHKERTSDFFWTIGVVAIIACLIALWFQNYLFAIFILISGGSLILFTVRPPQEINFKIENDGIWVGKERHEWSRIKGFTIKKDSPYNKLLIETSRYFLPVYTIPLPQALTDEATKSLKTVIPNIELQESHSMLFAEKLGL